MFEAGDEIICVEEFSGLSIILRQKVNCRLPIKGEKYIFDGYSAGGHLYLIGFNDQNNWGMRCAYVSYKFRKRDYSYADSILKEITSQIESDPKIKEEQLELA